MAERNARSQVAPSTVEEEVALQAKEAAEAEASSFKCDQEIYGCIFHEEQNTTSTIKGTNGTSDRQVTFYYRTHFRSEGEIRKLAMKAVGWAVGQQNTQKKDPIAEGTSDNRTDIYADITPAQSLKQYLADLARKPRAEQQKEIEQALALLKEMGISING